MDAEQFPALVTRLYAVVAELEAMFPGRHFTPDSHMVGSLGEALAAHFYGLQLLPASTQGCDAVRDGRRIEIKATQGSRVAFRCQPEYLLVIKLQSDGGFTEIYNGQGARVWNLVKDKPRPSNGQYQIALSVLQRLDAQVETHERIARAI
jgi:hypothetical protein